MPGHPASDSEPHVVHRRARARAARRHARRRRSAPSSAMAISRKRPLGRKRFQERARGLRVLDDEVVETARDRDRLRRQHVARAATTPSRFGTRNSRPVIVDARSGGSCRREHGDAGLAQHRREPDQRQPDQRRRDRRSRCASNSAMPRRLGLDGAGAVVGLLAREVAARSRRRDSRRNVLRTSTSAVAQRPDAASSSASPV